MGRAVRHGAFVDLEHALGRRLKASWRREFALVGKALTAALAKGDYAAAHAAVDEIDMTPVVKRHLKLAKTMGASAMLLGAGALAEQRYTSVYKKLPRQVLDSGLNQLEIMLARNATAFVRHRGHQKIEKARQKMALIEHRRVAKYSPEQPREPASYSEGGQWVSTGGFPAVRKHTPGGHEHDQSTHGNHGGAAGLSLREQQIVSPEFKAWCGDSKVVNRATGNRGTFDPDDPDITKHLPGQHDQESHGNWAHGGERPQYDPTAGTESGRFGAAKSAAIIKARKEPISEMQRQSQERALADKLAALPDSIQLISESPRRVRLAIEVSGDQFMGLGASVHLSRMRSYGFLQEAVERGLEQYAITAVLDERTTKICEALHGRVFDVGQGFAKMEFMMGLDDPDSLKSFHPWLPNTEETRDWIESQSSEDLAAAGLALPPFHVMCRSVCVPLDQNPESSPDLDPVERALIDVERDLFQVRTVRALDRAHEFLRALFGDVALGHAADYAEKLAEDLWGG